MATETLEDRTLLSTFTVNTTADTRDANPGDGLAEDAGGNTSLRAAIMEANASAGRDTIKFNIPGAGPHTISPTSALPRITGAVVIDGYTQPGSAVATASTPATLLIELKGSRVSRTTGLNITAGNSTVRGLAINRFHTAIRLANGGGNVIEGNHLGTDVTGTISRPNNRQGLLVASANNRIGTDGDGVGDAGERNVIAGQAPFGVGTGIQIAGARARFNVVAGNFIGTNATGTAALGTGVVLQGGITINDGARHNLVGTDGDGVADDAERNILSGHFGGGIAVFGEGTNHNVVAGNFIGTDVTGTIPIGNLNHGATIAFGARFNLIGTDADGMADDAERNVIAGNVNNVQVAGVVQHNVVAGNYIGTDVTGRRALGNNQIGVFLHTSANENRVGTNGDRINDAAEANLISGNAIAGVAIQTGAAIPEGFSSSGNVVAGNLIGTDVTGAAPLGNVIGVLIGGDSNEIGGLAHSEGNTIAFNRGAGVTVVGSAAVGNSIRRNSIHSNGGLGIDLGNDGVTSNDLGDADAGPNNLQNSPVLMMVQAGPNTQVVGSLNSTADTRFTIDVYVNSTADPSGFGEGERWIGSFAVTTDSTGRVAFNRVLAFQSSAGLAFSATAADPQGNTSEFSMAAIAEKGAAGIFVDVNNNGLVERRDIDVTAEASDGNFDTDVSEGTYVARNGVGLIVNQAVTAGRIRYGADGLMTVNADLTSIDTDLSATRHDLTIVSRFSHVILLDPTLTSANDVTIRAAGNIDLDDDTLIAKDDVTVTAGRSIDINNATLTAKRDDVTLNAGVAINAGTGIVAISAGADVLLRAVTGSLNLNNAALSVAAGDDIRLKTNIRNINAQAGSYVAFGGLVEMSAAGRLNVQNAIIAAGGDVHLEADGGNVGANRASITAAGDAHVGALGSVSAPGARIGAREDVRIVAETGHINMASTDTLVQAGGELAMEADAGTIHAHGGIYLAVDGVVMTAGGHLNVHQTIIGTGDDIRLTANGGDVGANDALIAAAADVEVYARGNVNARSVAIVAGEHVGIHASTGDINMASDLTLVQAGLGITMVASAGNIFGRNGTYTSFGGHITMTAAVNVDVRNAVFDAFNDVKVRAGNDVFAQNSTITSGNDVKLMAGDDINVRMAVITAGNDIVLTAGDEIFVRDAVLTAGSQIIVTGVLVGIAAP